MSVVSLGSVNVDRVYERSRAEMARLRERHAWLPERGETVVVEDPPEEFAGDPDHVRQGGKGANQAAAAARVGAETAMLGRVGQDHERLDVLGSLTAAGVDVDGVETAAVPTGTAHVFVGPAGENWIVVSPGANDTVDADYVRRHRETVLSADCLLLQNEIPPEPVAALLSDVAEEPGRPTVILDPAPAAGVETLLGPAVDYVTPNEREYEALRPALESYEGVVVRTRGAADLIVEGALTVTVSPPPVNAVDTTGAGDVLNGVLAARLAAGASPRRALEAATVAASLSTRAAGARHGHPSLEEVQAVLDATDR